MLDSKEVVPWFSWHEFKDVCDGILAENFRDRLAAVGRICAWRARGEVPISVNLTASLVELMAIDSYFNEDVDVIFLRSEEELRMSYSMAITRFVNSMVDKIQRGKYAQSVSALAASVDIPHQLVEHRHSSTHQELPSLSLCRANVECAFLFLRKTYWIPQLSVVTAFYNNPNLDRALLLGLQTLACQVDELMLPVVPRLRANSFRPFEKGDDREIVWIRPTLPMLMETITYVMRSFQPGRKRNNKRSLEDWCTAPEYTPLRKWVLKIYDVLPNLLKSLKSFVKDDCDGSKLQSFLVEYVLPFHDPDAHPVWSLFFYFVISYSTPNLALRVVSHLLAILLGVKEVLGEETVANLSFSDLETEEEEKLKWKEKNGEMEGVDLTNIRMQLWKTFCGVGDDYDNQLVNDTSSTSFGISSSISSTSLRLQLIKWLRVLLFAWPSSPEDSSSPLSLSSSMQSSSVSVTAKPLVPLIPVLEILRHFTKNRLAADPGESSFFTNLARSGESSFTFSSFSSFLLSSSSEDATRRSLSFGLCESNCALGRQRIWLALQSLAADVAQICLRQIVLHATATTTTTTSEDYEGLETQKKEEKRGEVHNKKTTTLMKSTIVRNYGLGETEGLRKRTRDVFLSSHGIVNADFQVMYCVQHFIQLMRDARILPSTFEFLHASLRELQTAGGEELTKSSSSLKGDKAGENLGTKRRKTETDGKRVEEEDEAGNYRESDTDGDEEDEDIDEEENCLSRRKRRSNSSNGDLKMSHSDVEKLKLRVSSYLRSSQCGGGGRGSEGLDGRRMSSTREGGGEGGIHMIEGGGVRKLKLQSADRLPWTVQGTKWSLKNWSIQELVPMKGFRSSPSLPSLIELLSSLPPASSLPPHHFPSFPPKRKTARRRRFFVRKANFAASLKIWSTTATEREEEGGGRHYGVKPSALRRVEVLERKLQREQMKKEEEEKAVVDIHRKEKEEEEKKGGLSSVNKIMMDYYCSGIKNNSSSSDCIEYNGNSKFHYGNTNDGYSSLCASSSSPRRPIDFWNGIGELF